MEECKSKNPALVLSMLLKLYKWWQGTQCITYNDKNNHLGGKENKHDKQTTPLMQIFLIMQPSVVETEPHENSLSSNPCE